MRTKVLFVGNGFDLNLGWPTSYSSYINSEIFAKLSIGDGSTLANYLRSLQQENSWVDIELELANYSQHRANEKFLKEYSCLCENLTEYINFVESRAEVGLNSKAYEVVESIYNPNDKLIVVNFNYTNSVLRILNEIYNSKFFNHYKGMNFLIYHVHGSADNKNIIFGVDDNHKIRKGHIEIRKSTFNDNGGKLIKDLLKSGSELYFFGFSLGETDHMYFRDFFKKLTIEDVFKKITFYHYQKEGRLGLHEQFECLTDNKVSLMKSNAEFIFIDVAN